MKNLSRILMVIALACMALVYFFPIWSITLRAPQYPSGITMYIWIDRITGHTPGTLQNINILNHYVGMKMIEPDSIPELNYFRFVIGIVILLGTISAIINKRWIYFTWVGIVVILGILAVYDFYLWEYDYGHNLSPHAAIKIPGMAYQPPLFGEKTLLNFKAVSYPYIGSLFIGASIIIAFLAFWFAKQKNVIR
jgi:copper chaperone NosL